MKLSLFVQPILKNAGGRLLRRLDVECGMTQGGAAAELVATSIGTPPVRLSLASFVGHGRHPLWLPEPTKSVSVKVELRSGRKVFTATTVRVSPCRPWRVHLLHHSHFDYGYTTLQPEILRLQLNNFDVALDYIERSRDQNEADRFRWNVECTFPLIKYLESRPEPCLKRLLAADRAGLLEVAAMPFTLQSEGCTGAELVQALQPVRHLREMGFSIHTAVQSDVPGVSALLPRLLNDIGIRHLAMAPNNFRAPFNAAALMELPRPFLWHGPHGGELLTWFTDLYDHVYQEGNVLGFVENLEAVEARIGARLAGLEESGFPWHTLGLRTQGSYADNGRPNLRIAEIVREWNAHYAAPQIRMSTFSQFFSEIETETRGRLKKVKAFWPDWWNEGIGSMARDFALHRSSQERAQFSETALALAGMNPEHSRRLLDVAWENILLSDEHTWGAAAPTENDERGPKSGELQMACKRSFFFQGLLAGEQAENAARAHWAMAAPAAATPTLVVLNALSWPRSGLVTMPCEELEVLTPGTVAWTFRDPRTGGLLASQSYVRGGVRFVQFHVEDVPALGQLSVAVEPASTPEPSREIHQQAGRDQWHGHLVNALSDLTLCPLTGALRQWKSGSCLLADEKSSFLLGSVVRQTFARRHIFFPKQDILATQQNENAFLTLVEAGPLFSRIISTSDCGEMKIRREWVLHHTDSRMDLFTTIRKSATNDPEAVFMALPLAIAKAKCILGTNGGPMPLDGSQIPGSSSDWFMLRDHLDVAGPQGGVMIALPDTPLIQLGDIRKPSVRGTGHDARELFVYVLNNLWPTNFAPAQGGEFTFRTMFMDYTHTYDAAWSRRRALECVSPLRAFGLGAGVGAGKPSVPVDIEAPDNVIATLSPQKGGVTMRVEEIGGRGGRVRLRFPGWNVQRIRVTNIIGEPLRDIPLRNKQVAFAIKANELLTLRIDFHEIEKQ